MPQQTERKVSNLVVGESPGCAQGSRTPILCGSPARSFPPGGRFQLLKSCSGHGVQELQKVFYRSFCHQESPCHLATALPFALSGTWGGWRVYKEVKRKGTIIFFLRKILSDIEWFHSCYDNERTEETPSPSGRCVQTPHMKTCSQAAWVLASQKTIRLHFFHDWAADR